MEDGFRDRGQRLRRRDDASEPLVQISSMNKICQIVNIEDKLLVIGGKVLQNFGLPKVTCGNENRLTSEFFREANYDIDDLTEYVKVNYENLLPNEREAYEVVVDNIRHEKGKIFFLDAQG
ncbi:Hypothetical predicted protein [Octopus vulgaris]|uniref:Uncharacterized protein n=1 Tax=Octopus vulgaris TaxID=6645 RepID=A0AA36BCE6_OCTVU|nr:Hypothetical predicted protein [Octopus vulgaris]